MPSGHNATQPTACEVASKLEATRRGRDKVLVPLPLEEDAAQPPAATAGQAGDPLPLGAAAVATVPETPPPSDHDATRPTTCEVASGLEATRRSRDKASAPQPPEEDAAQPPGAAAV